MLDDLLVGQKILANNLKETAKRKQLPHFQIFIDENGYGGLALSLLVAGEILNAQTQQALFNHPDLHFVFPVINNSSSGSKSISSDFLDIWRGFCENPYGSYDDWMQLLSAGNKQGLIGKHEIESLHKKIALKAYSGGAKVVVLWGAETLNETAANKMLKILEEPPAQTFFIFVASDAKKLLSTIQSRGQISVLHPLKQEEIIAGLVTNQIPIEHAQNIASRSDGSWHKALAFTTNSNAEQNYESLWIKGLRSAFQAKNNKGIVLELMQWAEELSRMQRPEQIAFVQYALDFIRHGMLYSYGASKASAFHSFHNFDISRFAPFINSANVIELVTLLDQSHYHLVRNANAKILFSDLALKLTRLLHQKEG